LPCTLASALARTLAGGRAPTRRRLPRALASGLARRAATRRLLGSRTLGRGTTTRGRALGRRAGALARRAAACRLRRSGTRRSAACCRLASALRLRLLRCTLGATTCCHVHSLLRWPSRHSRRVRPLARPVFHRPTARHFRSRVPRRATLARCEMSLDSENTVNTFPQKHKNFLARGTGEHRLTSPLRHNRADHEPAENASRRCRAGGRDEREQPFTARAVSHSENEA